MKRNTIDDFIEKAKLIHCDKYDYSKSVYINVRTKLIITCPIHGDFEQKPNLHLNGCGCPKCANNTKHTRESFINKSKQIHGNKYDYLKVEYKNNKTNVCIICPEHGEFWQTPSSHLQGHGCQKCIGTNLSNTTEFIKKAQQIHNGKYDYSKIDYVNNKTKVCVICPEHGEFWQEPSEHLRGHGCPKCGYQKNTNTIINFIQKARIVHSDKYDYSKVNYVNNRSQIEIICPIHGSFYQIPHVHLEGCGCPKCKSSHMESEIRNILIENKINFEEQKKFGWLGKQSLDFYLTDYNIAIECQGLQHFEPFDYFGSYETFKLAQERDKRKKLLCIENGINILYYANYDYEFPYDVITDKDELLKKIKINNL